jgi:hypothetical protein
MPSKIGNFDHAVRTTGGTYCNDLYPKDDAPGEKVHPFFPGIRSLEGLIHHRVPTNPLEFAASTGLTFSLTASYAENNSICDKIGKVDAIVKLYQAERRSLGVTSLICASMESRKYVARRDSHELPPVAVLSCRASALFRRLLPSAQLRRPV